MNHRLLYMAFAIITSVGCQNPPEEKSNSNAFNDPRDGQTYKTETDASGMIWFSQDLNHAETASVQHKDGERSSSMYTWNRAMNACPEGWRLPTRGEIRSMLDQFPDGDDTGADNAMEAYAGLLENADKGYHLNGMYVSNPSGIGEPVNKGAGEYGYYWTSTVGDNDKAYALRFDGNRKAAYLQSYDKRGMANCRCVKKTM